MNIENTYKILLRRRFLVSGLPESITPASSHLQIFDNYIGNTRIRLRKIRVPETKSWTRVLEQIFPVEKDNFAKLKISQMFLTEAEYKKFEVFKGREVRKNRYFCELNEHLFEFDIFLGDLWGLNIAGVYFETELEMKNFKVPEFSVLEITNNKFFDGVNLVDKSFADIQTKLSE